MRLCPWSLASSIPSPWPREGLSSERFSLASSFFVSLALASSLVSSTLPQGLTLNYLQNRFQVLQNKCLRVIDVWQFKQRIKPLHEKNDFININQIYFFEIAKCMFYCVHCLQPAIFDDYYKFVTIVSRHRLINVNDDKLYLPFFKKTIPSKFNKIQSV